MLTHATSAWRGGRWHSWGLAPPGRLRAAVGYTAASSARRCKRERDRRAGPAASVKAAQAVRGAGTWSGRPRSRTAHRLRSHSAGTPGVHSRSDTPASRPGTRRRRPERRAPDRRRRTLPRSASRRSAACPGGSRRSPSGPVLLATRHSQRLPMQGHPRICGGCRAWCRSAKPGLNIGLVALSPSRRSCIRVADPPARSMSWSGGPAAYVDFGLASQSETSLRWLPWRPPTER